MAGGTDFTEIIGDLIRAGGACGAEIVLGAGNDACASRGSHDRCYEERNQP